MDINLRFLSRLNPWLNSLFASKATLKTETDEAQQGQISLKTIANQYPLQARRGPITQVMLYQSLYASDNFVGREKQLNQITDVINQWRNHHGEISAIVSPAGAGGSSFLGQLPPLLQTIIAEDANKAPMPDIKPLPSKWLLMSFYQAPLSANDAIAYVCYCFGVTPPNTITETIAAINQQPPQLIMIDDMHKLMLRMMGNNQAFVTFATIIMETRKHHCWVINCEIFAWQRLSAQYQIHHFIKHVFQLDYFTETELAKIQTKHLLDLGLISHDVMAKEAATTTQKETRKTSNKTTQKSNDQAEVVNPYKDQLKQLYTISQGHPKLASLLLQYSLANQADINSDNPSNNSSNSSSNSGIEICRINSSVLQQCQDNDLFSLAEIYVHGGLRVSQHAHIFAITIEQSSLQLEYLARQGLIIAQYSQQDFAEHFYFITPTLSKIIASHLVNNNKLFN
ncbi:ATP-binding protein [Shewanella sp. SG41-4]|uniref:ATP-binding protein n=1 Tax=Shewanella sp. SG41-4 TaxID=2760976 RepID=UPI00160070D1|nr:ATP-binding protein [Shewanella sp. SG41-4]MBB1438622.1 ATP-binding protein [Shewanella sp. SG41-4]